VTDETETRGSEPSTGRAAGGRVEIAGDGQPQPPAGWTELLDYLHAARGFDFSGYKPASLMRRVQKRVDALRLPDFAAYQDYLEVHQDEFGELFDTILINVTGFFRDADAWTAIREQVVPHILAAKRRDEPVRVWSAGCATGEEAYTLAIVLAEAMGPDGFRDRVKIYATDADEGALAVARHGIYAPRQVEGVPPELLERYFERTDNQYTFRRDFRHQVIFGRHNLLQDAPISHIDLLACRNTLMYFNAETQAQVLARFQFAMRDGGYLFLGRAETMMAHAQSFTPVDLKRRISRKVPGSGRDRFSLARGAGVAAEDRESRPDGAEGLLLGAALEASPVAMVLLDPAGHIVCANARARAAFGLAQGDVGRRLQELRLSYRPVELRSVVEQAMAERRAVNVSDVEWVAGPGEARWFDLRVLALAGDGGRWLGTSVAFTDVTATRRLRRELEQSNQELETAYEELQSTNEELETTNEELQSTVEELETTNEELQSTNEELETMNEELQSTNEELQAINDELRQRTDEVQDANAFLDSVLTSLSGGVAVVDRELRVIGWNRHAEELWGLRLDEVHSRHLFNLDIGLPVEQLRAPLRASLSGEVEREQLTVDAVNRRGRAVRCEVTCTPLLSPAREIRGAILLMETTQP
jgi:two-component system CheB/CheR fusion protein